jgi:hypothetical protein
MDIDPGAQVRQILESLKLRPEQIDTSSIFPIFTPTSFFSSGNWPGPFVTLRAREIGLTWVVLHQDQAMRYVDFGMQAYWDAQGIDWKAVALRNLAQHSGDVHALRREGGEIYAVALMYPDGLGPSRLLLRERLCAVFPGGYQVALPEMSCALAFAASLSQGEKSTIDDLVDRCYRQGTRPLAPGIYSPEDLLPEAGPSK